MNTSQADARLNELLRQNPGDLVSAVEKKARETIGRHKESFILFGTGHLGRIALQNLRNIGKQPVAFADNNPKLNGTFLEGIPILSPADARARFPEALFVITVYTNAPVVEQLAAMGIEAITFGQLGWCYPGAFLPRAGLELPDRIFAESGDVRKALQLWGDDKSREEYIGQIAWRTTLDPKLLPPHCPAEETYFAGDLFEFHDHEVFWDCGAFDGDSIRAFLKLRGERFKGIVGFEPDPENRARFAKWQQQLPGAVAEKIAVKPYAVGERHETLSFDSTGTAASVVGSGTMSVECVALDEFANETPPTFVKMDIEGAEPMALRGASKIIKRDAPILAICLYHNQEHLWQIPLMIREMQPDYDLFLRRYSDECWEIVCYAIPKGRCK